MINKCRLLFQEAKISTQKLSSLINKLSEILLYNNK